MIMSCSIEFLAVIFLVLFEAFQQLLGVDAGAGAGWDSHFHPVQRV